MIKKFLFLFTIGYYSLLFSQKVSVIDNNTQEAISEFEITSNTLKKAEFYTKNGSVKLDLNNPKEEFIFYAIGYEEKKLSSKEIKLSNYIIALQSLSEELDEVVLSNTKWKQSKKRISKNVVSIKQKDFYLNNPQTSADAIAKTGKVFVQKSQQGGGSPIIRGFSTNRILISVDGVRMNTAIFRRGNLQNVISIDPLSLESTEIILGPGSVIYGSDAIGGTLNFKTLEPKLLSKTNKKIVSGNAFYRFSSANSENTIHSDVNIGLQKWAFTSSFSYNNFGDLTQGNNGPNDFLRPEFIQRINGNDVIINNKDPRKQIPSGYSQQNFLQKIYFKPNRNWDFGAQLIYTTTSNYNRYDKLTERRNNTLKNAEWFYGPQKWLLGLNTISYEGNAFIFDKLKLSNAYQFFEESRNVRDFNASILENSTEKLDVYNLNIDAEKKLNLFKLNYGFEYVYNKVNSSASNIDVESNTKINSIATRYPNGSTWSSIGAYSVLNLKLNQNLRISGGLRYNQVLLNAGFNIPELEFPFSDTKADIKALTWSLGSTYHLNSGFNFKANFDTAFRAPNIDDIGKIFDGSQPGVLVVPNPKLKSEYAYNLSTTAEYNKNNYNIAITGYHTFLEDALNEDDFSLNGEEAVFFRGELSQVKATQNSTSARIYGLEFSSKIPLSKKILLIGSYTITKGEETTSKGEKVNVRHVPPNFGNLHLIYKQKKWSIDSYLDFNEGFAFNDLAPNQRTRTNLYALDSDGNPFVPSWYTLNLRGTYNFYSKFNLTIALENITNQRYRTYSSGISAPGINFVSSLRYNF